MYFKKEICDKGVRQNHVKAVKRFILVFEKKKTKWEVKEQKVFVPK